MYEKKTSYKLSIVFTYAMIEQKEKNLKLCSNKTIQTHRNLVVHIIIAFARPLRERY